MHYGKINKTDIANGPGVRVSIWVSGCRIKCPGCFNPEAQSFAYGQEFNSATWCEISDALTPNYINGLTVLGGEPLDSRNVDDVDMLLYLVRSRHPDKSIWLYTGYRYGDVKYYPILDYVDVLVDGAFIEAKKDILLRFRGSSNQRLIDVHASRKAGKVVLWEDSK